MITKVDTNTLNSLKAAHENIFSFSNSRSNEFRVGVLLALRGIRAVVYATPEAMEAVKCGRPVEGAHLGDVNDRIIEYTDGSTTLYVIEDNALEVVVIDLKENNQKWDRYAKLTFEEKIAIVEKLGCTFIKESVRGSRGFDDCKKAMQK